MLSTYTSYNLISRDMTKALDRVEKQPIVDRDTQYYLDNITKVKSIDDFVDDHRLFSYAMKAYGLQDMTYAKAFMVKALKEGVSDPNSFANRLNDKRYAQFVTAFNFAAHGEQATVYNKAQNDVPTNYFVQAQIAGIEEPEKDEQVQAETEYYLANIGKVKSVKDLMADDRLLTYSLAAYGFDPANEDMDYIEELLEGGTSDPNSPANKATDVRYKAFAATFDFAQYGEATTTFTLAQQPTVDKYVRQTLEKNAGDENQGVQLALYFQRQAPGIKSFYSVLGDKALTQVLYTALGLPESFAGADIDTQVAYFEKKLDVEDFQDPEKLDQFLKRFTALWDVNNGAPAQPSVSILLGQPTTFGISTDLMLSMQSLKF